MLQTFVSIASRDFHFVYIVRCADGSFYTGYAQNPRERVHAHNAGKGARYTSGRRPVRLVYAEGCETKGAALSREFEIKQWTRARKRALIAAGPVPQEDTTCDCCWCGLVVSQG
jgi:putative endonuclease